ncbi:MAG: fibronectin type III domain-containing protein [bacterium]
MKFLKFSALFLMLVSISIIFYSCNETTSTGDSPVIDSINPTNGVPGTEVTILGSNFGDYNQLKCKVYFNGEEAQPKFIGNEIQWFDDEIVAIVPTRATTGNVIVEVDGLTSNGIVFTVPSVNPATAVMATSKDDNSVSLKWTASTDESNTDFAGYWLYVYPNNGTPGSYFEIPKGTTTYLATGLTEGTIYNFDIHAVKNYGGNFLLSPKATVKWSPASRFIYNINDAEIRIYETASTDFGSGLQLCEGTELKPKTLKLASAADWDLGIYTTGNSIWFGTPSKMKSRYSNFNATAKPCQIAGTHYFYNSLDELFDSQALDGQTYSEMEIDLSTLTDNKNVIFIVRTNSPTWNYAKIMLFYNDGYLQGDSPNRYIKAHVSYQKTAGVPYAL